MEEQGPRNSGTFSKANLKRFAAELGLDTEQFNNDLDSGRFSAHVSAETAFAKQQGITSTPTIVVNELIVRPVSWEYIQAAIELALRQQPSR